MNGGHPYNQKQTTINCIHWRSTEYYKLKCPAILKTKNESVIKTKRTHNRDCDPGECKAKEVTDVIEKEQFEESVVEKMDELAMCFKSTYIENPIANKKPPFPIEMWSQYDAAGEGVARTTISIEGLHYGLQAYMFGSSRIFGSFYRTWENILKMHSFICSRNCRICVLQSPPFRKNFEKIRNIRSTY